MRYLVGLGVSALILSACGDDPVNPQFDVQDVNITTTEDTPITITLPVASSRPIARATLSTMPSHGTVTSSPDNRMFTYTPTANFNGADTLAVTFDNGTDTKVGTAHITITPVDDAPVAMPDSFAASFNAPSTYSDATLLMNDTDVDNDPSSLTVVSVAAIAHGSPVHAGSNIVFTPDTGYQGIATFSYVISDGTQTATGTVTVTIGTNSPPVAGADTVAGTEDTPTQIPTSMLLSNDTDADHQTLAITDVSHPTHGTLTQTSTMISFMPDLNYNGPATFTYTVTDGAATSTGTVTINLAPVNDPPVVGNVANILVTEDAPIVIPASTLLANASDVDGDTLRIVAVGGAQHGTVALGGLLGDNVIFTPDANYNGPASFTFTVSDGTAMVTASASSSVGAVNDAPVAVADALMMNEDTSLITSAAELLANDTDVDGDNLFLTDIANATNGTALLNGNTITFTPPPNFHGVGGFDYTMSDGTLTSTAHVTITVVNVNDIPTAADDVIATTEDVPGTVNVLTNDADIDGDALTIMSFSQGTNGAVAFVAGVATYTPNANFNGTDQFTYTVSDGHGGMANATVRVTVAAVNDAPVAVNDPVTTKEDTAVTVTVKANDTDVEGDVLTVQTITQPTHGVALLLASQQVLYTPALNYNGPDSLTYTISDGHGGTGTATVLITVTPVNDAPVANDDAYATDQQTTLTVNAPGILLNDNDIDSPVLTALQVSQTSCGTLTFNHDGSFIYEPGGPNVEPCPDCCNDCCDGPCGVKSSVTQFPNGLCQTDSFEYVANDGALNSNVATVHINLAPVANPDSYSVNANNTLCADYSESEGSIGASCNQFGANLLQNDLASFDAFIEVLGPAGCAADETPCALAHGTLEVADYGGFAYHANSLTSCGPSGPTSVVDTFTYRIVDGTSVSSATTVTITVNSTCGG